MTSRLLLLGDLVALGLLGITVYLTRATFRRFLAASVGGVTVTVLIAGADALAQRLGWWYYSVDAPYARPLMYVAAALWYGTGVALIGWRLTRRFGWRGLVAFVGVIGVLGPFRDYAGASLTGAIVFAPGIVPVLGDVVCWAGGMAVIQAVMRLLVGPAGSDQLRPRRRGKGGQAA